MIKAPTPLGFLETGAQSVASFSAHGYSSCGGALTTCRERTRDSHQGAIVKEEGADQARTTVGGAVLVESLHI